MWDLEERSKNFESNKGEIHSSIGKEAPNFEASSINSNEKTTLDSIIQDNLVLIFMNSSCIYCENNLELFLTEAKNYPSFNTLL
ncbi:redoxin domain-containing protein [Ornithinibacillus sp. L9]|uniref:Redoxin domain-containing protein n=1 Tax=Ornithinibacillus caprae TaxID=2678566 RepID=A0A6N8FGD9_9BACI|nr:redoxin domain-containing protein [Ornithinibacillus caprae]